MLIIVCSLLLKFIKLTIIFFCYICLLELFHKNPQKLMCKNFYTYKRLVLSLFFFLLCGAFLNAQTFTSISTSDKCATNSDRTISVNFSFEGSPFPADNNFIIELSNTSGDFTNSTVLETLTDDVNNFIFDVNVDIPLPRSIDSSDDYRIKVTASSDPSKFIESTTSYSFSYIPEAFFVLNENAPVFLCNGDSADVSFEVNGLENIGKTIDDYSFAVFKDGVLYDVIDTMNFTITEEGSYFVSMYFGSLCSLVAAGIYQSNAVIANEISFSSVFIEGESEVEVCATDSHILEAGVDNPSFVYRWFKDDVLITGLPDYSPTLTTTADAFQFGTYHLVVEADSCSAESNEVSIIQKDADFTVTAVPNITTEDSSVVILLPGSIINVLAVIESDVVKDNLTYEWHIDGFTFGNRDEDVDIFDEGDYFVEVTDNSGDCPIIVNSEPIKFLDAVSLVSVINKDDDDCSSESTVLRLIDVNAVATDGNTYSLTDEEIVNFEYQWVKNGVDIPGANASFYEVASFEENDLYLLNVSVGGGITELNNDSNILDVRLRPNQIITSSSDSNQLCPGSIINLSIDVLAGFDYTWFKDGEELTVTDISNIEVLEVGEYFVTYDGFGCQNTTEIISIIEFTDDSVEVSPSTIAPLIEGEETILSATGADSYEWFDSDGNFLSGFEEVTVVTTGTYTLIAQVENCSVEKEVIVVPDDGSVRVPNIISPFNRDGANDTWKIPNRLSFQPNVNVVVYNSRGQEVLNASDYQNNWPEDISNIKGGMLFYYKIIQENTLIKAGTISVLE